MSNALEKIFDRLAGVPDELRPVVERMRAGVAIVRGSTGELSITADALQAGLELASAWGRDLVERAADGVKELHAEWLTHSFAPALEETLDEVIARKVIMERVIVDSTATPTPPTPKETPMNIRARMTCQEAKDLISPEWQRKDLDGTVLETTPAKKYGEQISLFAVYSNDKESPNYSFSQATPSATLSMQISNPGAWGAFKVGQTYDLTFSPTPAAE